MSRRVTYVASTLRPGGGPAGYLYNLRSALKEHFNEETLIDVIGVHEIEARTHDFVPSRGLLSRLLDHLPAALAARISLLRERRRWTTPRDVLKLTDRLSSSPIVVFHDPVLAGQYLALRKTRTRPEGQKVLVMTHAPTDLATEIVEGWRLRFGPTDAWESVLSNLQRLEINVYTSVDGLVGPCPEAFESYFRDQSALRERFLQLPVYEVMTGVRQPRLMDVRETYRSRLTELFGESIENRLVVGYFGRFHPHKGFDVFLDVVREAAKYEDTHLRFVVAGAGSMDVPHLPGLINLGWQAEEIFSFMNAVDIVISCNRVSYFDLATLEALALGKPMLATPVGGNRRIAQLTPGYVLFDGSAKDAYTRLCALNQDSLARMSSENLSAYQRWFSDLKFAEGHQHLAMSWLCKVDGQP